MSTHAGQRWRAWRAVPINASRTRALLQDWVRIVGSGQALRRRWRLSGVDVDQVRRWCMAGNVADALDLLTHDPREATDAAASPGHARAMIEAVSGPVPAGDDAQAVSRFCEPATRVGLGRLQAALRSHHVDVSRVLSQTAAADLAEDLGRMLRAHIGLAARTYRRTHPISRLLGPGQGGDALPVTLAQLCAEYPAVERLLTRACDQWVAAQAVLLRRLAADAGALADWLGEPQLLPVVRLDPGKGDPHRGGQRVARLVFTGGQSVAYKPRPLDMEAAFADILAWAHAEGDGPDQQPAELLARDGYGWMRWIEQSAPGDAAAQSRLARRLGALMAHFSVLGSFDIHAENLVIHGEYPVAVDLECLVDSGLDVLRTPRDDAVRRFLGNGILSYWHADPNVRGQWLNAGVLGSPLLAGIAEHADALIAGFAHVWAFWQARGPTLVDGDRLLGPLHTLNRATGRLLLRPTNAYGRLFDLLAQPVCLADARCFAVRLDALAPLYLRAPRGTDLWPALAAEGRSVGSLDVPYASFRMNARSVWVDDQCIGTAVLAARPAAQLAQRLASLTAEEGQRLASVLVSVLQPAPRPKPAQTARTAAAAFDLAAAARQIAEHLLRTATIDARGGAQWLGVRADDAGGILRLHTLGEDYYGGRAGIALFLGVAGRTLTEPRYQAIARGVLKTLAPAAGLGLGRGRAGQVFAWLRSGVDPATIDPVALDDESAPSDRQTASALDYLNGACGWITVACAWVQQGAPAPDGLPRQLTRVRQALQALGLVERLWAGQSHGMAGMARAAAAVARFSHGQGGTVDARWWADQAIALIDRESHLYDANAGEWQDLRAAAARQPAFATAWCHGSPGILAARLATRRDLQAAGVRHAALAPVDRDIDRALARTVAAPAATGHFLCCGETGIIDALLLAGQHLGRADLITAAHSRMQTLLDQAARTGYIVADDAPLAPATSGLFDGLAGIGYQLLRLHAPADVTSLLEV